MKIKPIKILIYFFTTYNRTKIRKKFIKLKYKSFLVLIIFAN